MIAQRDLREVARVLREQKPYSEEPVWSASYGGGRWIQWNETVVAMANMLSSNNPRFKRAVFYKACGYEEIEP